MGKGNAGATKPIVRSELLAAWSIAIDVAMAVPLEFGLRICSIAMRLARLATAGPDELFRTYHLALLRHIGCTAANREINAILGDERSFREGLAGLDLTAMNPLLLQIVRHVLGSRPALAKPAALVGFAVKANGLPATNVAVCEVAQMLVGRLGLGVGLQRDLAQVYERHDGRGFPHRIPGSAVSFPAQVVQIAEAIATHEQLGGRPVVVRMLTERRGKAMRPELVDLGLKHLDEILDEPTGSRWDAVIDAEPSPAPYLSGEAIDEVLRAFGDFVDLKSPFTVGHSAQVARLAGDAAAAQGLPPSEVSRFVERGGCTMSADCRFPCRSGKSRPR